MLGALDTGPWQFYLENVKAVSRWSFEPGEACTWVDRQTCTARLTLPGRGHSKDKLRRERGP